MEIDKDNRCIWDTKQSRDKNRCQATVEDDTSDINQCFVRQCANHAKDNEKLCNAHSQEKDILYWDLNSVPRGAKRSEVKIASSVERVTNLKTRLTNNKIQLETVKQRIINIHRVLVDHIRGTQRLLTQYNNEIERLDTKINEAKQNNLELQKNLRDNEAKRIEVNQLLRNSLDELAEIKNDREKISSAATDYRSELSNLQREISSKNARIEELEEAKKQVPEMELKYQTLIKKEKSNIAKLKEEKKDLSDIIEARTQIIATLETDKAKQIDEINNLKIEIESLDKMNDTLRKNLDESRDKRSEEKKAHEDLKNEYHKIELKMIDQTKRLDELRSIEEQLEVLGPVSDIEIITDIKQKAEDIETEIFTENKIEDLEYRINSLDEILNNPEIKEDDKSLNKIRNYLDSAWNRLLETKKIKNPQEKKESLDVAEANYRQAFQLFSNNDVSADLIYQQEENPPVAQSGESRGRSAATATSTKTEGSLSQRSPTPSRTSTSAASKSKSKSKAKVVKTITA